MKLSKSIFGRQAHVIREETKWRRGHGFEMDGNIILIMILICVYLRTEQNIFVFH